MPKIDGRYNNRDSHQTRFKVMRSPIPVFSVAEYLEAESKSELRHEYLGGQIFVMVGGSKAHNIITLNIASRLRSQLRGGICDVFMSDMKVKLTDSL